MSPNRYLLRSTVRSAAHSLPNIGVERLYLWREFSYSILTLPPALAARGTGQIANSPLRQHLKTTQ